MNTLHGFAISILLFIIGVFVPGPTTQNEVLISRDLITATTQKNSSNYNPQLHLASSTNTDGEPPQYPPVRNNHPGKRKMVPNDPTQRCPMWEAAFRNYGLFPIETWSYIAWRESGCQVDIQNATWDANGNMTYHLNKNKSYDTGLLQINSSWRSRVAQVCGDWAIRNHMEGLKTLDCNLKFARWLMENSEGGLSNWNM